jgi:branched-chain amino acid transport system substrate-binding protein
VSGRAEFWPLEEYSDDIFGTGVEWAEAIEAKLGRPHTYHQACASAAGVVLQKAIEAAGSLDNEAVQAALMEMDIMTFFGPIAFGSTEFRGEVLTNVNTKGSPASVQVINGNLEVVWPESLKTADFIYPKPW